MSRASVVGPEWELGLSESELIVTRHALDELRDPLCVLGAGIEDVERYLGESGTDLDVQEALDWILAAARPLVDRGAGLT